MLLFWARWVLLNFVWSCEKSCNMTWIGLFHWPWVMSFGWTCVKNYVDFWKLKIIAILSGVLYSLKELTLLNYFIKQCLFYFVAFLFFVFLVFFFLENMIQTCSWIWKYNWILCIKKKWLLKYLNMVVDEKTSLLYVIFIFYNRSKKIFSFILIINIMHYFYKVENCLIFL